MNPSDYARGSTQPTPDPRPSADASIVVSSPDSAAANTLRAVLSGELPFVPVVDQEGRPRLIPEAEYRQHRAQGVTEIPSTICLDPDQAPPPRAQRHSPCKREPKAVLVSRAIILVRDHPEWSNRQIAEALGVHHTTVGRWAEIQRARRMAVRERPASRSRPYPSLEEPDDTGA